MPDDVHRVGRGLGRVGACGFSGPAVLGADESKLLPMKIQIGGAQACKPQKNDVVPSLHTVKCAHSAQKMQYIVNLV